MAQFALRVPEGFVARMHVGDAADPLLRQVLPIDEEMRPAPGFSFDAVGDGAARKATGVIQKYRGRACWSPRAAARSTAATSPLPRGERRQGWLAGSRSRHRGRPGHR